MGRTLTLSDEAYRALSALAKERGQTPEALVEAWIARAGADTNRDPYTEPKYQTFDEFFLDLGMTEEEIRQARENAKAEDADV